MKNVLRLEETIMFITSILFLTLHEVPWWTYVLLLVGPDIAMLGYALNNTVGAICYNAFHHKGIALVVFIAGFYFHNEVLEIAGLVLFGHSSMDRMFGYGLKYFTGFKDTHLGAIGKRPGT